MEDQEQKEEKRIIHKFELEGELEKRLLTFSVLAIITVILFIAIT